MLKFSANLSLLFTELEFMDRFKAAKSSGFDAVEIQFPYSFPAAEIKQQLVDNQLDLVLFNIDADDLLQGGEGLASVPEKQKQFLKALELSHSYAEILHPKAINVLPGRCFQQKKYYEYLETFHNSLSLALEAFSPLDIKTVFEAINTVDMPDFIVHDQEQMLSIVDELQHPMLSMQYDIYHMHMMEENVLDFINLYSEKIAHIQFADVPGRGQPGSGTINFSQLFSDIDNSNYSGWLGAEYIPTDSTSNSLKWLKEQLNI